MRAIGVIASRVSKIGQGHLPGRRNLVDNHDKRVTVVLRRIPGVEQLFLVMALGAVEQPAADPGDEGAGKQRAARPARPGQHRRLDRPQAPAAEMLEGVAIGVGQDEAAVVPRLRPVERQRDLVRRRASRRLACGCGATPGAAPRVT